MLTAGGFRDETGPAGFTRLFSRALPLKWKFLIMVFILSSRLKSQPATGSLPLWRSDRKGFLTADFADGADESEDSAASHWALLFA